MNRYVGDRRPRLRPVQRVRLNEKNTKRRGILAALFACIGIAAIIYGFMNLLGQEPGWDTIKPLSSSYHTCGGDFLFQYQLGEGSKSAAAEKKEIQNIYTKACERAYWLFTVDRCPEPEDVGEDQILTHNLCYINQHPEEEIQVDEVLYDAFEKLKNAGNRLIFMGPLYNRYDDMFQCQSDELAKEYDPYSDSGAGELYQRLADYASDPAAAELELMNDHRIKLHLSDEYRRYVKEETGQEIYLDFFWMKNAFIIDFLADTLMENGYYRGTLNSFDGCIRNLNKRDDKDKFAFNISQLDDETRVIDRAGVLEYQGPISVVSLRDYRRTPEDQRYYYEYNSGITRGPYVSPQDGRCHSIRHDLSFYSQNKSCSEILLAAADLWMTDSGAISEEKLYSELNNLNANDIGSAFSRKGEVYYMGSGVKLVESHTTEQTE